MDCHLFYSVCYMQKWLAFNFTEIALFSLLHAKMACFQFCRNSFVAFKTLKNITNFAAVMLITISMLHQLYLFMFFNVDVVSPSHLITTLKKLENLAGNKT